MSKKPMSWLELIKLKLNEEKSKGNSPSINDIMPAAKKEWAQIKAGTHPDYMQGKAQTFARKKKGEKQTRKAMRMSKSSSSSRSSSSAASSTDIQDILAQVKMCSKCKKKVEKILTKKNMSGGYNQFYDVPPVGGADPAGNAIPGNPLPGDVTGYDKNEPTFAALKGGSKGKGKGKGKSKKQKGGGCGSTPCGGTSV